MRHFTFLSEPVSYHIIDGKAVINIFHIHNALKATESLEFVIPKISAIHCCEIFGIVHVTEHGIDEYFNYLDSVCQYDKYEFMKKYHRLFGKTKNPIKPSPVNPRFYDCFIPDPDAEQFTDMNISFYYLDFTKVIESKPIPKDEVLVKTFVKQMKKLFPHSFVVTKISKFKIPYYSGVRFVLPKRATM